MANLEVIAGFPDGQGADPQGTLTFDAQGNLLGTTAETNNGGDGGTIFEITKNAGTATGYSSSVTTLATFNGTDGNFPQSALITDASGNLYGVTSEGGPDYSSSMGGPGSGVVFELAKSGSTATGYSATPTTLASFAGTSDVFPSGPLITDAGGNFYATTGGGDANGDGAVFELAKSSASATGYSATPTNIATFNGTNGNSAVSGVISDASGNLYGTANDGGANGDGDVFEVVKNAASPNGFKPTPVVLASFNGTDGTNPDGGLIADAQGNLYGATSTGSGAASNGTVYEIAKDASSPTGYDPTPITLATFSGVGTGGNGASPQSTLIMDAKGNLFGTTYDGGTVFEIAKDGSTSTGYNATPIDLATPGGLMAAGLIADAQGNLYGTTAGVGPGNSLNGEVFEITNSGFAVCFASGTRIGTDRGDVAVEDLVVGDKVVTLAGRRRPVRWLGRRTIECPSPGQCPVRIRAGAFGHDLPVRDLYLSPGHPVLVGVDQAGSGGHLVPIMCLVNGTTVDREPRDSVTYWHVELDEHDILLAEGLPAESYIDLGSRPWFGGADGVLHDPDLALAGQPGRCRSVAVEGPVVEAERRRLDLVFAKRLSVPCAWPTVEVEVTF